ncbi:adenylate kinase 9 isoform X2 [Kryptolebias marmoratus]|uniref:adenylate kinase 9 isoform X2 n=1 Tax=Kryptolebias marmoratus TaxID=37003 RepID=UPI000D52F93F|nr:adenylate kinase 9 isoform X2 [Kryptolebias marmoratus]
MADVGQAEVDGLVDNLFEDEAERDTLLAKPTCFIILGRPGVGKTTLAKNISESWKCILIDDTDLLNMHIKNQTKEGLELLSILSEGQSIPEDLVLQLILARLNSPDIEHYGYVLSCLPCLSEECLKIPDQIELIKNLKLSPNFIINIKCADKDLVQRLSGLKQHPVTGQLYSTEEWKKFSKKEENKDQEVEEEEEEDDQDEEKELQQDIIDQMVWTPENLPRNASIRINMYKDTLVRPLEDYMTEHNPLYLLELDGNNTPEELHLSVMTRLVSMALKRVSVPVPLHHPDDEELPESIDTDDLLRIMSSSRTVAPGFRWRRSRWGRTCPVALKEGKIFPGKPEFSVGFQDKLYILSSQEAYRKFVTNPRRYLLPPMPRPPCKVSIVGPRRAGKSTMCRLLAQHYGAVVLDVEELSQPVLSKAEQEKLDKIRKDTTQAAVEKIKLQMKQDDKTSSAEVTEDHPEVKAMVLQAVEEAKQLSTPGSDLYVGVLEKHIKEIEELDSDAKARTGWVLDNFPINISQMEALQEAGILPDIIFSLRDSNRHQILTRIYEMDKESVNKAIKERLQDEMAQRIKQSLKQNEEQSEAKSTLDTVTEETDEDQSSDISSADPDTLNQKAVAPQDDLELGYPDVPEMKEHKLQMQQFEGELDQMRAALPDNHCVLEIGGKSPENLLQEMIQQMEKPFQYVAWELCSFDLDEEAEDAEALQAFEGVEEDRSDNYAEEEEDEEETAKRLLGDTKHFCPVALKNSNVLWPCTDEIAAKYRERTFYFSSLDSRDSFLHNPAQFVAQAEPLQPPALRMVLLGVRGSGKSTLGEWLAQKLGLFHIQFRELLQMLLIAKTKKRIPCADEVMSLEEDSKDLEVLIKETMEEMADNSDSMNDSEDVSMTEEEMAIKAYLSSGDSLSPEILDMVITPYWKQEPYMSTGFILEGFPHHPEQVQYLLDRQLFPDVVIVIEVGVTNVQKRLLPTYLGKWRELCNKRDQQLKLLRDLRKKNLEDNISKRRAELMAEQEPKEDKAKFRYKLEEDDEEDEDADNIEDQIEEILREEFPSEDDNEEREDDETEDAAIERMEMEIEERFGNDENNLVIVMELLSEHNIPKMVINASRKLQIIQNHLLQKIQPLLANRESLFQTCQPISYRLAQKLLLSSYKLHSAFSCWDPIQLYKNRDTIQPLQWPLNTTFPLLLSRYIYFFASKENLNQFMLNPLKYLRQPKPTPTLPIKVAVIGPPKSGKTTVAKMFAQKYGLARLSIGGVMRTVLNDQGHTDLADQMRSYLTQGLVVPDELAIRCLEVALLSSVSRIQGYVLDGFPVTLGQAELMGSHSIIPMLVVELKLDTLEVLKRGFIDKMKPNKPYLMHDSSDILHSCTSSYKKQVEHIRNYYQQQHQNWFILNGLKSKWWLWTNILKEVSISVTYIQSYLERTQSGQAACINRLCVTPKELDCRLGEFGQYCPVCLALQHHLVDCSDNAALTHAAEYRRQYYKLCGKNHLEKFLSTPDQFVAPSCPHTLPQPVLLPRKLTEIQVKNKFPQEAEMKGFCPVTYKDGKQRYEALIRGKMEYAVEYKERIYVFQTKQKQEQFLRMPENYWDQKLPSKVPPLPEPVPLTSLPTLGYLEQGVAVAVIKAMTAVGTLKPKYPFLSIQRSALLYVAFYLKAFNQKSTDINRQMYKKKLALFEENCELIPYLSSAMRGTYRPPGERPIDFNFKLNRFLVLGVPGANDFL